MDVRPAADAMVDVCPSCQCVWIDWFDGEPPLVAAATGALPPAEASAEPASAGVCPRCTLPLVAEKVADGVQVLRCGECAGMLVPRSSLDALARLADEPAAPPRRRRTLERLGAALRDVLEMFSIE